MRRLLLAAAAYCVLMGAAVSVLVLSCAPDLRHRLPSLPSASTSGIYHAASPEYGMNIFIWDRPDTTQRDLGKVDELGFGWQKTLFEWGKIEGAGKGIFDWTEADRVVSASQAAGLKIIARLDFQPGWARSTAVRNGPPDNYQDYADFVYALVDRYKAGSPHGRINAIEIWNEPNLTREWGDQPPDAVAYTRLLKVAYQAAKRADPNVTVLSAGLAPTGSAPGQLVPDDVFLQQMYDAGAKDYFDVLGAHAPGFKAPPSISPEEAAADPDYGGNRTFTFRRVEDLRRVMVKNGDAGKQVWLTEFGWTSDQVNPDYTWFRVTEEQKAQYITQAFSWAADHWSPWIGVMTLWNLPSPDWTDTTEEYWWSIANKDGTARPAFVELKKEHDSGLLP